MDDQPLDLTPKEFQLLEFFLLHPEEVVRRTTLLEKVWDMHFDPESNVVDVHVGNLRRKLAAVVRRQPDLDRAGRRILPPRATTRPRPARRDPPIAPGARAGGRTGLHSRRPVRTAPARSVGVEPFRLDGRARPDRPPRGLPHARRALPRASCRRHRGHAGHPGRRPARRAAGRPGRRPDADRRRGARALRRGQGERARSARWRSPRRTRRTGSAATAPSRTSPPTRWRSATSCWSGPGR